MIRARAYLVALPLAIAVMVGMIVAPSRPPSALASSSAAASGQKLLNAAILATLLRGSAHVGVTGTTSVASLTGTSITTTLAGDLAWAPELQGNFRVAIAVKGPLGATLAVPGSYDVVLTRSNLAARTGSHPWLCANITPLTTLALGAITTAVTNVGKPATSSTKSAGPTLTITKPALVGNSLIDGQPVWHVRAQVVISTAATVKGKNTVRRQKARVNVYGSRADDTIRRVVLISQQKVRVDVTLTTTTLIDFTQYGETVSVVVPDACNGKTAPSLSPTPRADFDVEWLREVLAAIVPTS